MTLHEEHREAERKKIRLNKIFKSEMTIDNTLVSCFVYIVDISEKGLKIHIDFPLPEDQIIPFKLFLEEPLEIKVKRAWQKELLGSMYIIGLEQIELSEENKKKINTFIHKYSPEGKRKAFRLNKVLAIEIKTPDKDQETYALTTNLSTQGMQILFPDQLPKDSQLSIKVMLDFNEPPIEMTAKVIWDKPTTWGEYISGLEFTQISSEHAHRINKFIEKSFLEATEGAAATAGKLRLAEI